MEFLVLGPLEVRDSGEVVRVPGIRQRKLLALLLLNANRVVPVERLEDELWADPPRSVRQQVHNAVGSLRATLGTAGEPQITRVDAGYRLDISEDAVDAHRFRRLTKDAKAARAGGRVTEAISLLTAALDLWRGDAMAGLADGKEIASASANLNEQRLVAVEDLMALRLATGATGEVVGELQRLVREHPMRESLRGHLMVALHRSGRQAEALAVYDDARRTLADELGLDPGPLLREIHSSILDGRLDDVPRPPVRTTGRSYLPYDIRDFSGRSGELVRLLDEVRPGQQNTLLISSIDGMGGVGKTTFAVHLAHRVVDDYPDGQYFIDLRGFSPGVAPVTPDQALDALLRDSGVPPELIPPWLEGRSALWRSRLAGQRALLILDNAVDAAHVRPLIPGTAGVLVLVTSRRKLTALEGAVPMALDVLPVEDAISLFTAVAGAPRVAGQDTAVTAAVDLCGRLPLAIRIAAARLRDRTTWTVEDLVNRLADQDLRSRFLQAGDRDVLAVLRVSYRYLPPDRQRLFRLLSLHPGTEFDGYAAAALAGCSLAGAEDALEALFDDNLLKRGAAERFYFHDLIRDCARQILLEVEDEQERHLARERLFDYYLRAVYDWSEHLDNRIYPLPPQVTHEPAHIRPAGSAQEAAEALAAEQQNLMAIAAHSAEHGMHRHAWQFPCLLQPTLRMRNYGEGSFELFERGLRAAREVGSTRAEAACLHGMAMVCRERRSTAEAAGHLTQALRLSRELGDRDAEAAQLVDLGSLHLVDDRLHEACEAFQAADALTVDKPDSVLRAAINNNLGVVYRDLGRYDLALPHLERSLSLSSHTKVPHAKPLTLWSVGAIHHSRGDEATARHIFQQILDSSAQEGFQHGEAVALLGLSGVHRTTGELDLSLDLGRRSLHLARKLELPRLECEVLIAIGETTFLQGEVDQAEKIFTQALEFAGFQALKRHEARAHEGLAHVERAKGHMADAGEHWSQAITLYPDGMAEAAYARHHLNALDDPGTTCFRCREQRPSPTGEVGA